MIIDSYLLIVIFGNRENCLGGTSGGKDKKTPTHTTQVSVGVSAVSRNSSGGDVSHPNP
jgi:hypothetical protein